MPRRLLAVAAVVLIAVAVFALARRGEDPAAERATAHSMVGKVPRGELDTVLRAAESASTATSRADLVARGRALFRSAELAKSGESCQSCHTEGGGANDELGTILHPQGTPGDFKGPRDVPSLWGVGRTAPYGWDGRTAELDAFVVGTIVSHFKTGSTQDDVLTGEQTAQLTAYLRSLEPPTTAFDEGLLSASARRGEELFQGKAGCMGCHGGPLLTDNALHNTNVPKVAPTDTDPGFSARGPLQGAFNTPQLRDLRNTAPYMHNGSLRTLEEVVEFYDDRATTAPLGLTEAEVEDLVAYLKTL